MSARSTSFSGRSASEMKGPHLASIPHLHPIKSLDGSPCPRAASDTAGGLELDRAWALHSADGPCINGKSSAAIHRIRGRRSHPTSARSRSRRPVPIAQSPL